MILAAENYARADKSDPFALARALAHIRSGVATITRDVLPMNRKWANQKVREPVSTAFWDAKPIDDVRQYEDYDQEVHTYRVTVYRDLSRP